MIDRIQMYDRFIDIECFTVPFSILYILAEGFSGHKPPRGLFFQKIFNAEPDLCLSVKTRVGWAQEAEWPELLEIFKMRCDKGCYQLEEEASRLVRDFLREENRDPESFGNARGVRNVFERILVCQATRLAGLETVTREDLMKLTAADVESARASSGRGA